MLQKPHSIELGTFRAGIPSATRLISEVRLFTKVWSMAFAGMVTSWSSYTTLPSNVTPLNCPRALGIAHMYVMTWIWCDGLGLPVLAS